MIYPWTGCYQKVARRVNLPWWYIYLEDDFPEALQRICQPAPWPCLLLSRTFCPVRSASSTKISQNCTGGCLCEMMHSWCCLVGPISILPSLLQNKLGLSGSSNDAFSRFLAGGWAFVLQSLSVLMVFSLPLPPLLRPCATILWWSSLIKDWRGFTTCHFQRSRGRKL